MSADSSTFIEVLLIKGWKFLVSNLVVGAFVLFKLKLMFLDEV